MLNVYMCERLAAQRVDAAGRYWQQRAQTEGTQRPEVARRRRWWLWTRRPAGHVDPKLAAARERTVTVLP